ncbi:MAG: heme biosynthesis HemY N-terminal domain-containing protein, partial [Pseudomonadota bacterium]
MLARTALWGIAVIAATLALVWLKDAEGGVMIDLNNRAYGPFRPLEFVALVVLVALLLWGLVKAFGFLVACVRFLSGDETAISRYWDRSRERRGFDALASGMTALAEGDPAVALTRARKAERLLEKPELTKLLVAQAAEASGETRLARDYYKQLASEPGSAYVGVKGLLEQALKKGDTEKALKLAQHAFELKPKDPELLTRLFDLQGASADWHGARKTLTAMTRVKSLPRDVADRRDAVLMLAESRASAEADEVVKSRDLARKAMKKSPGLIPAIVDVAKGWNAEGSPKKAAKVLKDAWRANPHPDLATAFAGLAKNETPSERRARFAALTAPNPNHPESRVLTAELAMADRDWAGARKAMGDLAETNPSARAFSIMAAIEKGEGGEDGTVRAFLAKAVAAPRSAQWTCANCGARHQQWMARCDRCDAFDSLDWKEGEADPSTERASMLPVM